MSNALSCICYPSSSVTILPWNYSPPKAAYTFCFRLLFSRAYFSGRDNNNSMHSPTNLLSSPLAHSHQFLSLSPSHTHARARTRAHTHTPYSFSPYLSPTSLYTAHFRLPSLTNSKKITINPRNDRIR